MNSNHHDDDARRKDAMPTGESTTRGDETRPTDPVVALQVGSKLCMLDDYRIMGQRKGRIAIGRDRDSDIRLDDETVSTLHCFVQRRKARVFLEEYGSRNKFSVNGVRVEHGSVELRPGMRVEIGPFMLYACGADTKKLAVIHATTLSEFVDTAIARNGGNVAKTAAMIGMPSSTLHDWVKNGRFGITPLPGAGRTGDNGGTDDA